MKALFLLSFITFLFIGCTSKENLGDKVVLDVNGDRWTAEDFSKELVFRLRNEDALMVKNPQSLNKVKAQITNDFIVQSLSAQWARKKGLLVRAEELAEEIDKVKSSYPDDLTFKSALADQGITYKGWKSRVEATMIQKLIIKKLGDEIETPSRSDVKEFYDKNKQRYSQKEKVRIRHIILPLQRDAKLIESELKKGTSIQKLADILNDKDKDAHLKPDVFWVEKGESSIFSSAFKMPIGRRSPVIKSEFGFHIFELLGKKYARTLPLNEVKEEIERELTEIKQQELYSQWIDKQIREARIFKNAELIENLRIETKEF